MLRDAVNNTKTLQLLKPQQLIGTTDLTSSVFDLREQQGAVVVFAVGLSGDTLSGSVKIECELLHSDDDSSYAACADADLSAAVSGTNTGTAAVIDDAAEDELHVKVGYIGNKRYIKGKFNITGTHTVGTPVAILGIGHKSQFLPV